MEKVFAFLNKKDNETLDQFHARYLGSHKDKVLAFGVEKYSANVCTQPSDELVKAGWGVYPSDQNVFEAFDEVWTNDVDGLIKLYDDESLICIYRVEENVVRSCVVDTPEGEPNFWLKRITLIRRREGMSQQDFFKYWQTVHGPLAAKHLIGAGIYVQNNVVEVPVGREVEWDGVTEILYWDVNAFKYGHFSQPDSRQVLGADCKEFIGPGMTLLFKEYIMKR